MKKPTASSTLALTSSTDALLSGRPRQNIADNIASMIIRSAGRLATDKDHNIPKRPDSTQRELACAGVLSVGNE